MELKILVKNTSYLLGSNVIKFIAGIVRTKLNAIYLGTAGVGLVNQLGFLTQKMSMFTTLSMSEAVVKQISENTSKADVREFVASSLKSYIILVFSFMFVSILSMYFFASDLTIYVFGDIKYLSVFYLGIFSFPLLLLNSIPFSILKGFRSVKLIAKARLVVVVFNLVLFIPLLFAFKLKGAIAFVPISFVTTLLINFYFVEKYHLREMGLNINSIFNASLKNRFVIELLTFSGFGLFIGLFSIITEFACRSIVVYNLGIAKIGLYSPIMTWAGLFTGFLLPSFSTYLYPRFCTVKSNHEISGILNDALKLGTLALAPLIFLGIPYRNIFIVLFYSKDFVEAGIYLPFHFMGVVFYVWWYIFAQSMTPTGRIKQHSIFCALFYSLDVVVTYILVPKYGLNGWMLKYIISPVIFFIVYFIYSRRKLGFNITRSNLRLMSYLILNGGILIFIISFTEKAEKLIFYLGPLMLLISFFLLKKNEKKYLINSFSKLIRIQK